MKKFLFVVALLMGVVLVSGSCKTRENCPAYGKLNNSENASGRF